MKVWVLKDDRVGSYMQSIALAEKLGFGYEAKNIRYNKTSNLPNFLLQSSLLGVNKKSSDSLTNEQPDIIIAAGRKLAPISLYIKKHFKGHPYIIQIMRPNFNHNKFDSIILPTHDDYPEHHNVIRMMGSLNKINSEFLKEQEDKWSKTFEDLQKPRIAILVGGGSKKGVFTPEMASELGSNVSKIANNMKASLLLTTSRRTSDEAVASLKKSLRCKEKDCYFYDWRNSKIENPYFGYMAVADYIITTGDSLSMCAESCSTGKPVYIYAPDGICSEKHKKLHQDLYDKGYAKPLTNDLVELKYFSTKILQEVDRVGDVAGDRIKKYFGMDE